MTWETTLVTTLRVLINDTEATQVYTDPRLQQILVVAAQYVQEEIDFTATYTIDIDAVTISPDPVTTSDIIYSNFVVLKAACITDQSTFRTKALLSGLKVRCGPAVLETMSHVVGWKDLIDFGPCAAYNKLKKEYLFGNNIAGLAILSPFVSNNYDPLNNHRNTR